MNEEEPGLVYYTGRDRRPPDILGIIAGRAMTDAANKETASSVQMEQVAMELTERLQQVKGRAGGVEPIVIVVGSGSMPTFDQYQPLQMDKGLKPGKSLGPRNLDNGVPKRRKKGR